jgi:hypothetical protein
MNPSNVLTTRVAEVVQARSRVSHSREMTIVPGSPSGLPRVDSSDFALCLLAISASPSWVFNPSTPTSLCPPHLVHLIGHGALERHHLQRAAVRHVRPRRRQLVQQPAHLLGDPRSRLHRPRTWVWFSIATILAEFASVVFSSREINKASAGEQKVGNGELSDFLWNSSSFSNPIWFSSERNEVERG